MSKYTKILLVILILAGLLRLYGLARGDTVTDEVLMAFRAIGMLDFDESEDQTTPLEWLDPEKPFWTKLSFHDHPPLVFLAQNISMRIFGENNFGFRFPSALFGIASVFLIYLITLLLYSPKTGILSALLLAVTANHIYISRIGLQESQVIFFILLSIYLFLRSLEDEKFLILTGVSLGFSFLTKYTTFILIPVLIVYLFLFKRPYLINKKLWFGAALALVIFSPVIIYNIQLYRTFSHFDFQFSYIFGQNPEAWQITPGKEIGTVPERISRFLPSLITTNSWFILILSALYFTAFAVSFMRNAKSSLHDNAFLGITVTLLILLIIFFIGPSYRFLTMLTPFIVIMEAVFLANIKKSFLYTGVPIILIFEILFSLNSQIFYYPIGPANWVYAGSIREENYNYGYNDLQNYLHDELKDRRPAIVFDMKYKFLEDLHNTATSTQVSDNLRPYSAVIIYDHNIDSFAQLWVLDRLNVYHAWPVLKTEQYVQYMRANSYTDITRSGFENYYFITPTDAVLQKAPENRTKLGRLLENELIELGIKPIQIMNKRNEIAFRVYKF